MSDPDLTLSIGAVARATGIPANTLRTWERRYGFPRPVRTDGGHRVYPADVVPHLLDIARALRQGMRPRHALTASPHALRAWARPSPGDDPLGPLVEAARALDPASLDRALHDRWTRHGALAWLDEVVGPLQDRLAGDPPEVRQLAREILSIALHQRIGPLAARARGPRTLVGSPTAGTELELLRIGATLALAGRIALPLGAGLPEDALLRAADRADAAALPAPAEAHTLSPLVGALRARGLEVVLLGPGPELEGATAAPTCAALDRWAQLAT